MPSVSVLYIDEGLVAPHLELLRNICEPKSKSKPHITVRYFRKLSIPEDHLNTTVRSVDLLSIGSFGLNPEDTQENYTVYVRCQCEDLLHHEHKPFFPTSEFHITLYDGNSRHFAQKLLSTLTKYEWGFRLPLVPPHSLTQLKLKAKKQKAAVVIEERKYREGPANLFEELTGKSLDWQLTSKWSDAQRLQFVRIVCASLMKTTRSFDRAAVSGPTENLNFVELNNPELDHDLHLTPPELAKSIADFALSFLPSTLSSAIDFGDPAVGTGAFFAALNQSVDATQINSAIGIDISPKHIAATRWRWANRMEVIQGDYLHLDRLPSRNLILANPPYLRHQAIPAKYKAELRQRASGDLGMRISGLSGQYVYFMLLSDKWMAQDGIAAWLVPSEFMRTQYGAALRYYLTHKVRLLTIHQFDARTPQFENAEVLPCVVVFQKALPKDTNLISFTSGPTLTKPDSVRTTTIGLLKFESRWRIEEPSFVVPDPRAAKIKDLFTVKRGIATGANDFFVLEESKSKELGIPKSALKSILPKAQYLNSDIVECLSNGSPKTTPRLVVIDCNWPEKNIIEKFPKFFEYLQQGANEGITQRHLVARRRPWYSQEQRLPSPFLCTYMGKAHGDKPAIRFIRNKSNAIVTNTYLMLYPKPHLAELIEQSPHLLDELFEVLKRSTWTTMREYLREHSGGLTKIEPRELSEVSIGPLPDSILRLVPMQLF